MAFDLHSPMIGVLSACFHIQENFVLRIFWPKKGVSRREKGRKKESRKSKEYLSNRIVLNCFDDSLYKKLFAAYEQVSRIYNEQLTCSRNCVSFRSWPPSAKCTTWLKPAVDNNFKTLGFYILELSKFSCTFILTESCAKNVWFCLDLYNYWWGLMNVLRLIVRSAY